MGTIALVGYTNAGKSTLFNALSRAEVLVSSRMFATLDPTIGRFVCRRIAACWCRTPWDSFAICPKGLLTAFRATLEEVQEAALILHVSDVSNPHHAELDEEVDKILNDLGVADRPRLRVFNKVDRLTQEQRAPLIHSHAMGAGANEGPVLVSGLTGEGVEELLRRMDAALPVDPVVTLSLRLPLAEGRTLALVHALGRVLHSEVEDSHMLMDAEVPVSIARKLKLSTFAKDGTSKPHACVIGGEGVAMIAFILWCILFFFCWPLALLALVVYPIVWLILLPFRIAGIAVHGVLAFLRGLFFLPARLLRGPRAI